MLQTVSASVLLQQLLSGLKACADYEIRISAVTPSGLTSEKANISFTTSEDTPSAPRALTHITVTVDQIELHWFAPLVIVIYLASPKDSVIMKIQTVVCCFPFLQILYCLSCPADKSPVC